MKQMQDALLEAFGQRRKFESPILENLVDRCPSLEGILRPYDGTLVIHIDQLDYLSVRYPTPDEKERMDAGARFIGDNLVIQVDLQKKTYRSTGTEVKDNNRHWPSDICRPSGMRPLTLVITNCVEENVILMYEPTFQG